MWSFAIRYWPYLALIRPLFQAAEVKNEEEDAYADAIEFHGHGESCFVLIALTFNFFKNTMATNKPVLARSHQGTCMHPPTLGHSEDINGWDQMQT